MKLDTYCDEWRRITEARWYLRECKDRRKYIEGVTKLRGEKSAQLLLADVALVRPHINTFTKKIAAELIDKLKEQNANLMELDCGPHYRAATQRKPLS